MGSTRTCQVVPVWDPCAYELPCGLLTIKWVYLLVDTRTRSLGLQRCPRDATLFMYSDRDRLKDIPRYLTEGGVEESRGE